MENIIGKDATILDALKKINSLSSASALTLFIVDNDNKLCGTLTDGDIRRGLVQGATLETLSIEVAQKNFKYIKDSEFSVAEIIKIKKTCISLLPILDRQMQILEVINLKEQKSYLPIDAVLMAGGKGERLRPLTEKTPKPLLKVGDRCIIDYNIERLISYGVRHISVTVNYLKEQLEEHFSEPYNNVQIKTVREPMFLGTIGSIKFVENFYNDTVLLMNSDLFTNIDYEDFFLHFKEHEADMSIAAVPYTISVPYGIFELDGRNVKGVLEKPTYNYYANAGIYLIRRKLLDLIPAGEFFNATDFIDMLMQKGYKVIRFPLNGTWIDIGNPQEYQKAIELVKHIKFG